MIKRHLLFAGVVAAALPSAALAESLRCRTASPPRATPGIALVYKCGQPTLRDNYCAPVYYSGSFYTVPDPIASLYVPCIYTEEWLYERGPGEFVAVHPHARRQGAIDQLRPAAAVATGERPCTKAPATAARFASPCPRRPRSPPPATARCAAGSAGPGSTSSSARVKIEAEPDALVAYCQGDRTLRTMHCRTCGCVTHWEPVGPRRAPSMASTSATSTRAWSPTVRVRRFDGADTWKFFDELVAEAGP